MSIKVTVIKKLNVRTGRPSLNAPCFSYLTPGSVIEVEETQTIGEFYDGNNLWYKGLDGNYYWSGGVTSGKIIEPVSELKIPLVNYNQLLFNVPDLWKNTSGNGIKIAVLDSGLANDHPDLLFAKNNAIAILDFAKNALGTSDISGHGSHCLGLIGAKASKVYAGITGVSPQSKYLIGKVKIDNFGYLAENLAAGIESAIENKVDIISMSLDIPDKNNTRLKNAISAAKNAGIVMVASAGNNGDLIQSELLYPAMFPEVIAVGAIDQGFVKQFPEAVFNKKLDFILPLADLISCSLKQYGYYKTEKGSSMVTALASGVIALLFSKEARKLSAQEVKKEISAISQKYDSKLDVTQKLFFINPIHKE